MYGDIAPVSIEDYYAAYSEFLAERTGIPEKRRESSLSEQAILKLLANLLKAGHVQSGKYIALRQ